MKPTAPADPAPGNIGKLEHLFATRDTINAQIKCLRDLISEKQKGIAQHRAEIHHLLSILNKMEADTDKAVAALQAEEEERVNSTSRSSHQPAAPLQPGLQTKEKTKKLARPSSATSSRPSKAASLG